MDDQETYGPLMAAMNERKKCSDWQPFSEDNWEKEMEEIPLFMNQLKMTPGKENPALEAIQALVYDGTPEGPIRFFL